MAIGTNAGNDQGASSEIILYVAGEVGRDVLKTAKARSELTISGDRPNILFLEPEKFSKKYIDALSPTGGITDVSIQDAKKASLGLSIEAALQIIEAKSYKNILVEDTGNLADVSRMLGRCEEFVSEIGQVSLSLLISVADEISTKRNLNLSGDETLVKWANESVIKAKERIGKKIIAIDTANNGL